MASEPLPSAAKRNVELITQIERQLVERRSRAEQVGDAIAHFFGSLRFIVLHAVALVVWLAWNSGLAGLEPFDPYPFPLLGLVVGVEFILLTTFVLMNQEKQSRRQEQWAHLNLQVCLLTEQEVTKNVQMLHLICKHLKLAEPAQDKEVSELARATSVSELAKEIDKAQ